MINEKKALLAMTFIIKIVIAIAGFIIVLAFIGKFLWALEESVPEQACRTDIIVKQRIKDFAGSLLGEQGKDAIDVGYPVSCITQEVYLPEKKSIFIRGDSIREQVLKEISTLTVKCWWMFGNGEFHNLFGDEFLNENKCHICYDFRIKPGITSFEEKPLTKTELIDYMTTHRYEPGLITGGGAVIEVSKIYRYLPQSAKYDSNRILTPDRIITSRNRLDRGVADFTGIFTNQQLATMRSNLIDIFALGLEPIIVIVPELPNAFEDEKKADMAMRILDEWHVGNDMQNGMVFFFSLNDGILHYSADIGAYAIIDQKKLEEQVIATSIDKHMGNDYEPVTAFLTFTEQLKIFITAQKNIETTLASQGTYMSYITGGKVASSQTESSNIKNDGALFIPIDFDDNPKTDMNNALNNQFIPDELYSVAYISPKWFKVIQGGATLLTWNLIMNGELSSSFTVETASSEIPNAITISIKSSLLKQGKTCDVITED